jgi:hypothetical protein
VNVNNALLLLKNLSCNVAHAYHVGLLSFPAAVLCVFLLTEGVPCCLVLCSLCCVFLSSKAVRQWLFGANPSLASLHTFLAAVRVLEECLPSQQQLRCRGPDQGLEV